jgi:PhnB protein
VAKLKDFHLRIFYRIGLRPVADYVLIRAREEIAMTRVPASHARRNPPHFSPNYEEKIMSKVSYIPKDYNTVTPYLVIKNAAQAIEYYKKVFGATELFRMNGPDGKVGHAEIKIGNSHIMLADENPAMGEGHTSATTVGGSPVSLYIYLPDVDKVVERAAAEGAKILKPVQDQFYGDRNGFLRDPFGHLWGVATHVEDVSPKELEERMKKMRPAA